MLLLLALIAVLTWTYYLVASLLYRRRRVYLTDLPTTPPPGGWPDVGMVIAARNEEKDIERAVRSMLALAYPRLTVVAVNDRSTDNTGKLLHRLAADDARLKVVDVQTLPAGWLGKNHALHYAAADLTSQWILFTDADIVFSREALQKAVAYAEAHGYDHVTMFPEIHFDSPFEKMFLAAFGLLLGLKMAPWFVEWPRMRTYLGIGAFNLVRRSAFQRIGGFDHLKLSVDDDLRLGAALKVHGYRTKVMQGTSELKLKWQSDILGYIRGLEKNGFAGLEFSWLMIAWAFFGMTTIGIVPYVALAAGDGWTTVLGLWSIATTVLLMAHVRRSSGVGPLYALTMPLAMLFMMIAIGRSVVKTVQRDGIVWREHHYPLKELKAHVRERRQWMNDVWRRRKTR